MFLKKVTFLLFLPLCFSKATDVTFKDVTFRGYNIETEKIEKTIRSSNSLKEYLPKWAFYKVEFVQQKIPVLYENSLADLEDLNELIIEFCAVREIQPGAIKNSSLLRLSLKGNKLEEIKEGVFNDLEISYLDLSENSITIIESGAFNDLPKTLNIYLDSNKISQWNKNWFENTPYMTKVSMQNNSLSKLPNNAFKNIKGKKQLESVKLRTNLFLSNNKIKEISPKAFSDLSEIHFLWLDDNLLETFDGNLLENVHVHELMLQNNKIKCLEGDLSKIIKADTTHLYGNPMDCECIDKIKRWAKNNQTNVLFFFDGIKCSTKKFKNKMEKTE